MLSEELKSIRAALGGLLDKVDQNNAEVIRQCRRNLEAAEEQADNIEKNLVCLDWTTEGVEISLPHPQITISAREIKISGVLPARELRRAL